MSSSTFTVVLSSPSFLNRRLFSSRDQDKTNVFVCCTVCRKESRIIPEKSSLALKCGHMIQCTECRDYNLEKIMRCQKCCRDILGYFVEGCSPQCPRNIPTVKVSALCAVCGSHLRKEAKCCRSSESIKQCKKLLRSCMTVFVQHPSLISSPTQNDRPCSHYTLCQFCKSNVTKGHRSSTACKVCRSVKKKSASVMIPKKDREVSPERKKRCTLGALSELVEEIFRDEEDDDVMETSSPASSEPTDTALRFGPKCGAPIWALVNPSNCQTLTQPRSRAPSRFLPG